MLSNRFQKKSQNATIFSRLYYTFSITDHGNIFNFNFVTWNSLIPPQVASIIFLESILWKSKLVVDKFDPNFAIVLSHEFKLTSLKQRLPSKLIWHPAQLTELISTFRTIGPDWSDFSVLHFERFRLNFFSIFFYFFL